MDALIENSWKELIYSAFQAPVYHVYFEIFLLLGIVWLFFKRSYKPLEHSSLTKAEEDELIAEWTPDPLVSNDWKPDPNTLKAYNRCVTSTLSKYVVLEDYPDIQCLNAATFNFMNFIGDKGMADVAIESLRRYGVGSCGPRGFYGTMDVHLQLEEDLARFMGCSSAAIYSYGFSTISTAIPAYAKRTDIIYADEGVCYAVQKGLVASRSKIHFFKHNDMKDLERLLKQQEAAEIKDPKRASMTRKFIVVEGLYINYGDICPLTELLELKFKYKVRLFIDETMSIGVLGTNGRGVTEHWGLPIDHVDMICGSLENALGSTGGFCVGTKYVINHQRLSAQGYCFSASAPPLLAAAASYAVKTLEKEEGERSRRLRLLSSHVHGRLSQGPKCDGSSLWQVGGDTVSPIKHLRLTNGNTSQALEDIVDRAARDHKIMLTLARYLDSEHIRPEPSIRLSLNCDINDEERNRLCQGLECLAHP